MPPYADVYTLAQSRDEATVVACLNHFAPRREESSDDYCVSENTQDAQIIFKTAAEAIAHCCMTVSADLSIYWRRIGDGDPEHVMVFFTSDGYLILGLSVYEENAESYLEKLKKHARSSIGYFTFESAPPLTGAEFQDLARRVG